MGLLILIFFPFLWQYFQFKSWKNAYNYSDKEISDLLFYNVKVSKWLHIWYWPFIFDKKYYKINNENHYE